MSETVQYRLEQMIPELEELQKNSLITPTELKVIVRRRTKLEYALKRIPPLISDYKRYIDYETQLEELVHLRIFKSGIKGKRLMNEFVFQRRINFLYERALKRFPGEYDFWLEYLEHLRKKGGNKTVKQVFLKALKLHPTKPELWIKVATWEYRENERPNVARALFNQGLLVNPEAMELWLAYYKLECCLLLDSKPIITKGVDTNDYMALDLDDKAVITVIEKVEENLGKKIQKITQNSSLSPEQRRFLILSSIYDEAVAQHSQNSAFPLALLQTARLLSMKFPQVLVKFEEKVFLDLKTRFPNDFAARVEMMKQEKLSLSHVNLLKIVENTRSLIQELEEMTKDNQCVEAYYHRVKCIADCLEQANQPMLRQALGKAFSIAIDQTIKANLASLEFFEFIASKRENLNDFDARDIFEKATKHYPHSEELWKARIESTKLWNEELRAITEAIAICPEYPIVHERFVKMMKMGWEEDLLELEVVEQKIMDVVYSLNGHVANDRKRQALSFIQRAFLDFLNQHIPNKYEYYQNLMVKETFIDPEFLLFCIGVEKAKDTPNLTLIKAWFEKAVQMRPQDEDLWLNYIQYFVNQSKFGLAVEVFNRASLFLDSNRMMPFTEKYRHLTTCSTSSSSSNNNTTT